MASLHTSASKSLLAERWGSFFKKGVRKGQEKMETIGGWLILYLWIGAVLRDVYLRKFAAAGEPWHKSWAIVVGWFEMLTVFVALYTVALAIHKAIPASTYVRIRETSKVS